MSKFVGKFLFSQQGAEVTAAARTSWVFAVPVGPMSYDGQWRDLTEEYLNDVASETERLLANSRSYVEGTDLTPYTPPVLERAHDLGSGSRMGRIIAARTRFGSDVPEGQRGLWLQVAWTARAWAQIEAEEIEFVSIQIWPEDQDERGETYSPIVIELSLTAFPRFRRQGRLQDTLTLVMSSYARTLMEDEETQENGLSIDELADALLERMMPAIDARIDERMAASATVEENEEEEGEGEEEEGAEGEQGVELATIEASTGRSFTLEQLAELREFFTLGAGEALETTAPVRASTMTREPPARQSPKKQVPPRKQRLTAAQKGGKKGFAALRAKYGVED